MIVSSERWSFYLTTIYISADIFKWYDVVGKDQWIFDQLRYCEFY